MVEYSFGELVLMGNWELSDIEVEAQSSSTEFQQASCIRCENELETGREEMNYRGGGG
jgi:hypothetical protein